MIEELFMTAGLEGLFAFFAGMFLLTMIVLVGVYVYTSFAFMKLGKKVGLKAPGIAWIPFMIGPLIIAYKTSKMHWWPWLLIIGFLIPILNFFAMIAFAVFAYIWLWKLFEAVKKPGWWPLLALIPFIGTLIFLVMVGIAAWSEN